MPWVLALEIAVDLAVDIAVEIAMVRAMGLHGVPLHDAAFRGSLWNVRGSPWSVRGFPWTVRGCPWKAVEIAVECRGGPWALPRCSAKRQIMYIPLITPSTADATTSTRNLVTCRHATKNYRRTTSRPSRFCLPRTMKTCGSATNEIAITVGLCGPRR